MSEHIPFFSDWNDRQMMEGAAEGGADVSTLSDSFLTTGAGQFVVEGKFSLRKKG